MTIQDRRARDRAARRQLITTTARKLAEAEGWDTVTTRRLSTEIEYSQPVLYKHFRSMDEIGHAVAIEGFGELAEVLSKARKSAARPEEALERIAHAFMQLLMTTQHYSMRCSPELPSCTSPRPTRRLS